MHLPRNALRGVRLCSPFDLMGAELSQHKAPEPNNEGSSNNALLQAKPEPSQRAKQVSLPHNYEDILKHGDSPIDKSSTKKLLEQLYAGVFLNKNRKKYWIEESNRNCFFLFARHLSITWGDDNRYWKWSSDESLEVAELINVCWLELHGKFEMANLSPGTIYEFVFVLKLIDPAYGWEVPVNLRLTLPDGSKQQRQENLMTMPRHRWIEISVGELKSWAGKAGEIQFSLYETEGGQWKKGLIIKGVIIRPKASVYYQQSLYEHEICTYE